MLRDEARTIVEAIDERVNAGLADKVISASVRTDETRPDSVPTGAGRPTFIRYLIEVSDGERLASLDLGQAELLLDSVEPGCDADRVFDVIRGWDVPIVDAPR